MMNKDFVGGFCMRTGINKFKLTLEEIEEIRESEGFNHGKKCCGNCIHIYFAPHDYCQLYKDFVDIYNIYCENDYEAAVSYKSKG